MKGKIVDVGVGAWIRAKDGKTVDALETADGFPLKIPKRRPREDEVKLWRPRSVIFVNIK